MAISCCCCCRFYRLLFYFHSFNWSPPPHLTSPAYQGRVHLSILSSGADNTLALRSSTRQLFWFLQFSFLLLLLFPFYSVLSPSVQQWCAGITGTHHWATFPLQVLLLLGNHQCCFHSFSGSLSSSFSFSSPLYLPIYFGSNGCWSGQQLTGKPMPVNRVLSDPNVSNQEKQRQAI